MSPHLSRLSSRIFAVLVSSLLVLPSLAQQATKLDPSRGAQFQAEMKTAVARCPDTAGAEPGQMVDAALCIFREWRKIWAAYSAPTLALFDSFGEKMIETARKFDSGEYSRDDARQLLGTETLKFYSQLKTMMAQASNTGPSADHLTKQLGTKADDAHAATREQPIRSPFEQRLKEADARCPNTSAIVGSMKAVEECILSEERKVWADASPATLDLFDSFASQVKSIARDFDSGSLTAAAFAAALNAERSAFRTKLKARVEELTAKPATSNPSTMTPFQLKLTEADRRCQSRAVAGQMVSLATCTLANERQVWAEYNGWALDLFDAFAPRLLELARKLDDGRLAIPDYMLALRSERAAFFKSVSTRATQRSANLNSPLSLAPFVNQAPEPQASTPFEPAQPNATDNCVAVASVVGIIASMFVRSGQAATGLNAATSYLKGCTGQQ